MKHLFLFMSLTVTLVFLSICSSCSGEPTIFSRGLKPTDYISNNAGTVLVCEITFTLFDTLSGSPTFTTTDIFRIKTIGDTIFRGKRALKEFLVLPDFRLIFNRLIVVEEERISSFNVFNGIIDSIGHILIEAPVELGKKWRANPDEDDTNIDLRAIINLNADLNLPAGDFKSLMHQIMQKTIDGNIVTIGELYLKKEVGLVCSKFTDYSPGGKIYSEFKFQVINITSSTEAPLLKNLTTSKNLSKISNLSRSWKDMYGR